jgi:hypothetical protein
MRNLGRGQQDNALGILVLFLSVAMATGLLHENKIL